MTISKNKWIEYFQYLDDLRESGVTNMFGAGNYLQEDFEELDRATSRHVVVTWMETFSDLPPEERVRNIE